MIALDGQFLLVPHVLLSSTLAFNQDHVGGTERASLFISQIPLQELCVLMSADDKCRRKAISPPCADL